MKIAVVGAAGRLGSAIVRLGGEETAPVRRGDDLAAAVRAASAVIDVSHHSLTGALVDAALAAGRGLVIGTTGHPEAELARLREASAKIPVLLAPNFSVGVTLLGFLAQKAAEVLRDYDQEIVEMHHRHKKDAPSGTARRLAEVLCAVKGKPYAALVRDGRSGETGARTADEIGLHALRGGDVIGDHTVVFAGEGERIELTHKASTRDTFAVGALRAARWIAGKPPGWYGMEDALGLKI
ncbi:MAG: 4-hydroxy-tetrahydrodipicolinate reductase [Verrucomicrobium sp.]|nr:4-hydroxy-tetrahydrodipicolinate reductase [Verrucomicrobium sp.]